MLDFLEKLNCFKIDVQLNGVRAAALVDTGGQCSMISPALAFKVGALEAGVKTALYSGSASADCELISACLEFYTTHGYLLEKKVSLWKAPFQSFLAHYELTLGLDILSQFEFNVNYRDRCLILRDGSYRIEFKYLSLTSRMSRDLIVYKDNFLFLLMKLTRSIPRGPKDVTGWDPVGVPSPILIGVRCALNEVERKIAAFIDTGATVSMVHPSVLKNAAIKRKVPFLLKASGPFGQKESAKGTVTLPLVLGCVLGNNIAFEANLYVFQDCGSQMVIGNDILERFSCRVTNRHILFSTNDGCVLRVRYADLKD